MELGVVLPSHLSGDDFRLVIKWRASEVRPYAWCVVVGWHVTNELCMG
jgi:hypothetical protein